jgi:hypothetical protein
VLIETNNRTGIVLFESRGWQVMRLHPSGYVEISIRNVPDAAWTRISLPLDWRRHAHPLLISENSSGDLFVAVYDLIDNSPSGRRLDVVTSGIDLYRLKRQDPALPERIARGLPLGGIDTLIYGDFGESEYHLCGNNRCFTITSQGQTLEWNLGELANHEFVEVGIRGRGAAALLRKQHDDRINGSIGSDAAQYHLVLFGIEGVTSLTAAKPGVPWDVHWRGAVPHYRIAETKSDLSRVFFFDFNRMGWRGPADFGANNLEGRIAWSQVYYLHGLLSILSGKIPDLKLNDDSELLRRLTTELNLMGSLCDQEYPGFRVKRYSLDREPLLFALHLGRIAALMARAHELLKLPITGHCLRMLNKELLNLEHTVEEQASYTVAGLPRRYLRYRSGSQFWADGANVPYNYVSGYVEGMLLSQPATADDIRLASEMLSPLIKNEMSDTMPNAWKYWWGQGDDGWSEKDGISLNTLRYQGNQRTLAHITYRTMDAKALLELARHSPGALPATLVQHLRTLTAEGWLLPDMNEYWSKTGNAVPVSPYPSLRYARSSAVWELQAQVWALASIAENMRDLLSKRQ